MFKISHNKNFEKEKGVSVSKFCEMWSNMRLKKQKQKHQIQRKVGTLPKEICSQKWGQQKSQRENALQWAEY